MITILRIFAGLTKKRIGNFICCHAASTNDLPRFLLRPGAHVRAGRRGISYIEKVPFSQSCSAEDLGFICRWSGLSYPRLAGISLKAYRRLLVVAAQRRPTNHYHRAGHFAHVVIASGLLAYAAGLTARERACWCWLLGPDPDHPGVTHQANYSLRDSVAQRGMRIILAVVGMHVFSRLCGYLKQLLIMTTEKLFLLAIVWHVCWRTLTYFLLFFSRKRR